LDPKLRKIALVVRLLFMVEGQ